MSVVRERAACSKCDEPVDEGSRAVAVVGDVHRCRACGRIYDREYAVENVNNSPTPDGALSDRSYRSDTGTGSRRGDVRTFLAGTPLMVALAVISGWYLTGRQLLFGFGVVIVVAGTAALGERNSEILNRWFGRRWPFSIWFAFAVMFTAAAELLVWLLYGYSPEGVVFTALFGLSSAYGLSALLSAYGRINSYRRRTVPLWIVLVSVSTLVVGAVVYAAVGSLLRLALFMSVAHGALFLLVILPIALYGDRDAPADLGDTPPVISVIVPAYNETKYIGRCLERVLASDYPSDRLEVIVVDDGSTDGTYYEAASFREEGASVFRRENGGKHGALNLGVLCSSGELIVTIDADSLVDADALGRVAAAFQSDPELGAVAGHVKVVNRDSFLTRLQSLEYILSVSTIRRAFGFFGAVPVVPGCLGGFRREALEAVDEYDPDTITEDFDATVQILKEGYTARQIDALVWTEAPFTWRDLYRQRLRWYQGNAETMLKHKDVFTDDSSRYLHRLVFPFRFLSSVLIPVLSVGLVLSVPLWLDGHDPAEIGAVVVVFVALTMSISYLVLHIERESYRHLLYAPFLALVFRFFMAAVICISLVNVLTDRRRGWRKVGRLAQQGSPAPTADAETKR